MDDQANSKISIFDNLFTNNTIRILKLLLPALPVSMQKMLVIYIKFSELLYVLHLVQTTPECALFPFQGCSEQEKEHLFDEIIPFCNDIEKEKIQNYINFYKSYQNMQEMMQTLQLVKDFFPETDNPFAAFMQENGNTDNGFDISSLMQMFQNN